MAKKKSAKTAKTAKTANTRPKTSPYVSPLITLRIGPERWPYHVPEDLLQKSKVLYESLPWRRVIDLPDVDAQSAHVIVHFLHTGTYQTLADGDDEDSSFNAIKEFEKAASVFITAKKYDLIGLKELAKVEIQRWSADMTISEIGRATSKKAFEELQDNSPWFQDLVFHKVEAAFDSDDAVFSTNGFFDSIASATLASLLAQRVIRLYQAKVLKLRAVAHVRDEPLSRMNGTNTTAEPVDVVPSVPSEHRIVLDSSPTPAVEAEAGPCAFDFDTPKLRKKEKEAVIEEPGPPQVQPNTAYPEPEIAQAEELIPENDPPWSHEVEDVMPEPLPAEETTPENNSPWSHEVEQVVTCEPPAELFNEDLLVAVEATALEETTYDPLADLSKLQHDYRQAEDDESELLPAAEELIVATQTAEEAVPVPEPDAPVQEPAVEPEPETPVDPFARLTKPRKKKSKKMMKAETRIKEQQDADAKKQEQEEMELKHLAHVEHQRLFGTTSDDQPLAVEPSKKKKKKKITSFALEEPPPPPPAFSSEPGLEVYPEPEPVVEVSQVDKDAWDPGARVSSRKKKKRLGVYEDAPITWPEDVPEPDVPEPEDIPEQI
ncbi:hypothetical protein EJ07DRAFT_151632 [Lizonia empirigonia]|nr:hypothetical protein EJ07DRAFT_151632 [Lizonia empirigonia]